MIINKIPPVINTSNIQNKFQHYDINFGLKQPDSKLLAPLSKGYDGATEGIARILSKIMESKPFEGVVNFAKESKNLVAHLTAFTSLVLSGFYINQTLKNDKLDSDRKKTLAINQAATTVLSTICAYAVDNSINQKISEVTNKFLAVNFKNQSAKFLDNCKAGIGAAKSIIIFGTIYRFISPVIVTPLANAIGNKLNEKKQTEANSVAKV